MVLWRGTNGRSAKSGRGRGGSSAIEEPARDEDHLTEAVRGLP